MKSFIYTLNTVVEYQEAKHFIRIISKISLPTSQKTQPNSITKTK
jgi:hypothetical protein